jgi:pantetheine-phosphate adenylyltransferase
MKRECRLAVYAGSFDPPTIGHVWMIEQGIRLFDQVVVAIGVNPDKRCAFGLAERVEMLRSSTKRYRNVKIDTFSNQFLITYARSIGASHILRGIRSESDYEYERVMRNINGDLNREIGTVFLMPPRGIAEISSSMVKGLIGPAGWEAIVRDYVPKPVFDKLIKAYRARSRSKQVD